MYITERVQNLVRGFMKSYGPTIVKRRLWDEEFSGAHWDFIDNTAGDCVYAHLEQYAANGSILDLGCGPGNTANELAETAYNTYLGVDISAAALRKAIKRTELDGRAAKNSFELGDIISHVPGQENFDVILFRESMYHVPLGKVKSTLLRYSGYLKASGVFIVRVVPGGNRNPSEPKIELIEAEFDMLEKRQYGEGGPIILVFRARR